MPDTQEAAKAETIFREYLDSFGVRANAPYGVRYASITLPNCTIRGLSYLWIAEVEARTAWGAIEFPESGIWLMPGFGHSSANGRWTPSEWPIAAVGCAQAIRAAEKRLAELARDPRSETAAAQPSAGPALEPAPAVEEDEPLRRRRWKTYVSGPTTSAQFDLDLDEINRVIAVIDEIVTERLALCAKRERERAKGGAA